MEAWTIMPRKRGRKSRSAWGSNEDAGAGRRRLRYWADLHDGRGYARHSKTIVGTKTDGDLELARLRVAHDADGPCPTVGQAWEMWVLPEYERRLAAYLADPAGVPSGRGMKPKTHRAYMSMWENHVAPAWADVRLSDVRARGVQDWLDGLKLSGKIDVWTLDELVYGLWPQLWGHPVEGAFILSSFGSCRPGESLGPMVDEIGFDRSLGMTVALVPIVRQVGDDGTPTAAGDLKNGWSERTVAIPEPWSLRLEELCSDRAARPVWLSDRGDATPWRGDRMRDAYARAEERAGLPHKEARAQRRSWRSWMADMGIPGELLEKMMGHVPPGVTGRHYLALPPEKVRDVVVRAFTERPISVDWDKLGHRL